MNLTSPAGNVTFSNNSAISGTAFILVQGSIIRREYIAEIFTLKIIMPQTLEENSTSESMLISTKETCSIIYRSCFLHTNGDMTDLMEDR